jgi:hypothetical protein
VALSEVLEYLDAVLFGEVNVEDYQYRARCGIVFVGIVQESNRLFAIFGHVD